MKNKNGKAIGVALLLLVVGIAGFKIATTEKSSSVQDNTAPEGKTEIPFVEKVKSAIDSINPFDNEEESLSQYEEIYNPVEECTKRISLPTESRYINPNNPNIQELSIELSNNAESDLEYAKAGLDWLDENIEYVVSVEEYSIDQIFLREEADCGGMSHIMNSLLLAKGIESYTFRVRNPDALVDHELVVAKLDGSWFTFEATVKSKYILHFYEQKEYELYNALYIYNDQEAFECN